MGMDKVETCTRKTGHNRDESKDGVFTAKVSTRFSSNNNNNNSHDIACDLELSFRTFHHAMPFLENFHCELTVLFLPSGLSGFNKIKG